MAQSSRAWVTYVPNDEKIVTKALVLARSLKRVCSAIKTVVFASHSLNEELTEKLLATFDLVIPLPSSYKLPIEEEALIQALTLKNFEKCVYLSPECMILKNCDELFDKFTCFGICNDECVQESTPFHIGVIGYIPSLTNSKSLKHFLLGAKNGKHKECQSETSSKFRVRTWLRNNVKDIQVFDKKYNVSLYLKKGAIECLEPDAAIITFLNKHPLDGHLNGSATTGALESHAVRVFHLILAELRQSSSLEFELEPIRTTEEPIAIVGMSCRLPGANNIDEFWELLSKGMNTVRPVPPSRWGRNQTFVQAKDRSQCAGFLSTPIDEFDNKFFGISPREAELLDPQQKLLHEVTWEALEDATMNPLSLRGTDTSFYVGTWIYDYREVAFRAPDFDFYRIYMGNSVAVSAARLSHFYQTTGPSIGMESACSSSLSAIHMACKNLQRRETNLALACGANLIIHPFEPMKQNIVLSPTGQCRTFDSKADGFARAEGCCAIVLKRLSDAVRDGDDIWAMIRGSAIVQEGVSRSMGTPTIQCEALAMELALKDAGVKASEVSFVEAHGTGTPVGDPMEVAAIANAYGDQACLRKEPLYIGSVKTNIGHTEAASGLAGLIKVILSMKNEMIPAHLNFENLNPEIKLDEIPARIPLSPVTWPRNRDGEPRLAGVSSFGISGTDGHLIVQEPPSKQNDTINWQLERSLHILKVSAKCEESLLQLLNKYETMLELDSELEFRDVAHTANIGRASFSHRACIIARNSAEALTILREKRYKTIEMGGGAGSKLCFLFTGQGSQYNGMAKELYETSPVFRSHFENCRKILKRLAIDIDLFQIILGAQSKSNAEMINRTLYSQISIFVVEYCLLKLWETWGVKPDYVIGHSLGEFAAAVAVGALDIKTALKLVTTRSILIDGLPQGKMLVVKSSGKTVTNLLKEFEASNTTSIFWLDVAALNSPDQTVVAGNSENILAFSKFLESKEIKSIILASTHAFHSRHMESILKQYASACSAALLKLHPNGGNCKYISGVEGKLVDEKTLLDKKYWVKHCREKVNFMEACKTVQNEGCNLFLEIGPHPILTALTMMNIDSSSSSVQCLPSIRNSESNWETLLGSLSNLWMSNWDGNIDWIGFDKHYNRKKVSVPFYPFIRRPIWAEMEPHRKWSLAPLLGTKVASPSNNNLFDNCITVKQFSYLPDHSIGNTILFPGAGFLEICLCAGHAAAQGYSDTFTKPHRAVGLTNLEIVSPLAISDLKACTIQTVAKLAEKVDEEGGSETSYKIEVYHWHDAREEGEDSITNDGKWILHANASFLPFVSCSFDKKQREINVVEICNTWASKEWNSSEIYENIAKLGLRLGSSFQRINKAWFPDDGNEALFEMKVLQQREREEYMVHPVIGDAMIQAIMMWSNRFSAKSGAKWKKRLQIPVKVGEFTWFPSENIEEDNAFIYCFANEEGNTTALLLNQNGEALARMGAVEFIETSAKFVEGLIHQQTVVMPKLWEEVWRPCPDALQNSISPLVLKELPHIKELEIRSCMEETNNDGDLNEFEHVCKLTLFQFLKALSRLGFQPQAGERFTTAELFTLLSIKNKFKNYVGFFLEKMVQQNYLSEFEQENWIVQPQLETDLRNIVAIETATLIFPEETAQCDYRLVCEIGGSLAEILTGKVDPLSLIFPEDPRKPNAEGIYEMVASQMEPAVRYSNATLATIFPTIKTSSSKNCLRVLEIGSGTGVNTTLFFDCIHSSLEKEELDLEYLYTDISSTFFAYAKENPKLEKYLKHITFKKLDIEIDPISQGFSPEYFDVILAAEVLHVTKNVRKAVENLGKLIKPSGFIQIYETVRDSPILMFVFGLLDGYWQFQDFDLRKKSPVLSELKWKQILEENGFTDVSTVTNYNGVHAGIYAYRQVSASVPVADSKCSRTWMIFGDDFTSQLISKLEKKMNTIGRNMLTVQRPNIQHCQDGEHELRAYIKSNLNSTKMQLEGILYMWGVLREDQHDQSKISFPFLSLCQELVENIDSGILKSAPKLFILTNGLHSSNDPAMFNPSSSTLLGIAKSVPIEYNNLTVNVLDIHDNVDDCVDQVFFNLWAGENKNDFHSFRNGKRFVRRMKSKKISSNNLSLPSACDRFQLALPATRQIADLEFTHLDKWNLGENQVEIHVKAMALNFRDVFTVLKPIPIFEEINTIGMDFSGVVTSVGPKVVDFKVGDNVIGFNSHNNLALPSHILVDQNLILHLPSGMTHCEGATLPAVFMTSIYCLFNLARIQPSETVLIHTASGGVGLSAIQLALQHKAKIIATAGSRRKRTYLKNLGVSHVFNSRTTEFSNEILEVTNGRGVDIVLNSLTGPGFKEASLKALATNGRFVEMSKLSVWSKEEVAELRGDVEYHMIDIKAMSDEFIQDVMKTVKTRLKGGTTEETIKALAFERFDALDIRSALFYLQQAKHIGKVVCVMPEIKRENSRLKTVTQLFNERSTYIVTGGLGGIGFEVVKWMLRNGAKYIAIVSRNSSPKSEIAEQIQKFNEKDDKHIRTFSVDVSMYEKCKKLFEKIKSPDSEFPAIRGIMHAAGLLDDATIENQTWDKFQSTYNSKVNGSWNLHLLTKTLNLEHFVLFSSISSVLGAPGQANYSASNNFEDALAHYRHGQGLPAISINWGHWAEVGIATEADFPGVRPISTSEGLLLLGSVLRSPGTTQVVACNIESFPLLSNMFPNLKQYADDQSLFGEQKNQFNSSITSDEFWKEVDSAEDRLEKIEIFKKHIKIFVRNILKMEANELIGDSTDFQSLGVDSLMMLEMKNSIQNLLGSRLVVTPSHIRDCNNVELLANRFMDLIESKEEEDELPSLEELRQLIHEDCQLPEHIIAPETSAVKESDIQTVLLTGSTGTLGRYILQDILKSPSIRKVYCLVRKIGNSSPAERLKNVLEKRGVENDEKIEALEGDISKDSLGLDEQLYHQLSSEVDAVVHCAVKSDHVAKYWKAPVSRLSNVRNVNVLGTRRVIEFATNVRAKHIFHASSLLVVTATNEMDGTLTEDWQEDTAYDCLTNNSGYVITKFVSEQLVKQAWIRGLPCKVLRFALVSGDGETGELDIFSSHYMLRLLAFLKLECMQDAPMPSLLIPPNDCSKALIGICFNEKANSGVYNVVPARPQLEQVFINVAAEIGIKVELVTLTEFLKRLNTMEGDDNRVISQLKIIYTLDENRTMEILCGFSSIRKWIENSSDDFFVSRKLKKLMPTFQEGLESAEVIMRRDIEFAKKSGAFKAIGLQQGNGSLHRV